ncbi:PREDICTED: deleted in malignant brain tumors 1 protein-like [Amphimedon queenslandica]|uniref:Deleted in malignant brain tumors 1 protein n=2 Tax=Amphimedon queenslandica TaxID=400682 RepID=A0AAN0JPP1_AMPQE|nr:PREDICTED: deleted in malignant brain tumors 1 protein-like [Amphimedon queenslandica]|eukprot:XP_019859007.1 PREDICTED: deleted in malignant brain tumors 1 protein-like [Amphimedon queenslandica]
MQISLKAGQSITIQLQYLETFLLKPAVEKADLTGTKLESNNPISVYSAHSCVVRQFACAFAGEQIPPVASWGNEFLVPSFFFFFRQPGYILKLIGSQANTNVNVLCDEGNSSYSLSLQEGGVLSQTILSQISCYVSSTSPILVAQLSVAERDMTIIPPLHQYASNVTSFSDLFGDSVVHLVVLAADDSSQIRLNGTLLPSLTSSSWEYYSTFVNGCYVYNGYKLFGYGEVTIWSNNSDDKILVMVYGYYFTYFYSGNIDLKPSEDYICELSPCQNGGSCTLVSAPSNYTCDCTDTGYQGINCSTPIRKPCKTGSINLVNGSHDWEGRVEVCVNKSWGTVCDNNWDSTDAAVVCSQLDWGTNGTALSNAYFGQGNGSNHLDNVQCLGTEQLLTNCTHSTTHNCGHSKDAGVACHVCTPGTVRLVNGSNSTEGRVELCHNGKWGTVCDDYWGNTDANVVCRQLGYDSGTAFGRAYFGQGTGLIVMDDVHCNGAESYLTNCTHTNTMYHNCYHFEDAGVRCSLCTPGSIHLIGGSHDWEGRVELCNNGLWATVCDNNWDSTDAAVVCRQLGWGTSGSPLSFGYFGQSAVIHLDNVQCLGSEQLLTNCMHLSTHNCGHYEDAGVACHVCTPGTVRLVNGRVELCHNGRWGTVCDDSWDNTDASVVCRQLGLETNGTALSSAYFGQGNGSIFLANVSCNEAEMFFENCTHDFDILSYNCSHSKDAGVMCLSCIDGSIRLVGGTNSKEGRVEVCSGGMWGTVCDDYWDNTDASVVCRQLGYHSGTAFGSAYFGQGTGSIVMDNVHCNGTESLLKNCTHITEHNCNHNEDAGVKCVLCADESIRLVNGSHDWEGRVEVCVSGSWGTVCDNNWDSNDAAAVCRQLGWGSSGSALLNAYFGQGDGSIHLDNVHCFGTEQLLTNCRNSTTHNCGNSKDAGVACHVCTPGTVRLVNGSNSIEGRVELCHNGRWGTVCDDSWDNTDASVVCRQLGYGPGTAFYDAYFGQGNGSVVIDDVDCNGSESYLTNCTHTTEHNCNDKEVAGVRCSFINVSANPASNQLSSIVVPVAITVLLMLLAVFGVGLFVACFIIKRRNRKQLTRRIESNSSFFSRSNKENIYASSSNRKFEISSEYMIQLSSCIIPGSSISMQETAGQGEFGIVYRGVMTYL